MSDWTKEMQAQVEEACATTGVLRGVLGYVALGEFASTALPAALARIRELEAAAPRPGELEALRNYYRFDQLVIAQETTEDIYCDALERLKVACDTLYAIEKGKA